MMGLLMFERFDAQKNVIQISTDCSLKKKNKQKENRKKDAEHVAAAAVKPGSDKHFQHKCDGIRNRGQSVYAELAKFVSAKKTTRHNGFLIRIDSDSWSRSSAEQHFTVKMSRGDKQDVVLTSLYANTILPVSCSVAWKVKLPRL